MIETFELRRSSEDQWQVVKPNIGISLCTTGLNKAFKLPSGVKSLYLRFSDSKPKGLSYRVQNYNFMALLDDGTARHGVDLTLNQGLQLRDLIRARFEYLWLEYDYE